MEHAHAFERPLNLPDSRAEQFRCARPESAPQCCSDGISDSWPTFWTDQGSRQIHAEIFAKASSFVNVGRHHELRHRAELAALRTATRCARSRSGASMSAMRCRSHRRKSISSIAAAGELGAGRPAIPSSSAATLERIRRTCRRSSNTLSPPTSVIGRSSSTTHRSLSSCLSQLIHRRRMATSVLSRI